MKLHHDRQHSNFCKKSWLIFCVILLIAATCFLASKKAMAQSAGQTNQPKGSLMDSILSEDKYKSKSTPEPLSENEKIEHEMEVKYPYTTVESFLKASKNGETFWSDWRRIVEPVSESQSSFFGGGLFRSAKPDPTAYFAKNLAVKKMLENSYGVQVPYGDGSELYSYSHGRPPLGLVIDYFRKSIDQRPKEINKYDPEPMNKDKYQSYCPLMTGMFLASGVGSVTRIATKSYYNIENEKKYLADLYRLLDSICREYDQKINGEKSFIDSYKNFLGRYHDSVASTVENKRITTNIASADEAARKKAEKLALYTTYEAQIKQKKQEEDVRTALLRSGKEKPKNIADAILMWDPANGYGVVASPPVSADNKIYAIKGKLVRKNGNSLIFELSTGRDLKYYSVVQKSETFIPDNFTIRYESYATVVGRFVGLGEYTTVAGVVRVAPTFQALMIAN